MKTLIPLFLAASVNLPLSAAQITCTNLSCLGSLDDASEVVFLPLDLALPANVVIQTWSAGGGTNRAGNLIPPGGFDPIVSLFGPAPDYFLAGDDDDSGCPPALPAVSGCLDSRLQLLLGPGSYVIAISAFPNFALGPGFQLADGFLGFGDFAGLNNNFAFDVIVADVPEPGGFLLLGSAAVLVLRLCRRRRRPVC